MKRIAISILCLLFFAVAEQASAQCDNEVTRTEVSGTFYGQSVAIIGDIDGDLVDDYIVGAPNGTEPPINLSGLGRAYVYSGANPQSGYIWSYSGQYYMPSLEIQNGQFGYCVAGDVNGDGYPDFMVGAPNWREESSYWLATGRVKVFEGNPAGGYSSLSFPIVEQHGKYRVGTSLAAIGDITGDGRDEILIGAPKDLAIDGNNGMAYVYSYQYNDVTHVDEWVLVYELDGVNPERLFGKVVSAAGDVNHDGVPDFMVAGPAYGVEYGIVFVYSGATGTPLWTISGQYSYANLGHAMSPLGDVNGDNYDDFVIVDSDTVRVYSGQTGTELHNYANGNPSFGTAVSTVGDYNDDGIPDVLISMPDYSSMHIFSGAADVWLANIDAGGTNFGTSLAGPRGTQSDGYGITVSGAPGSDEAYVFSCGYPDADIEALPMSGDRPLTVDFAANSSPDVTAWDWDFGDGGDATDEDPSYQYLTSGNFTVSLTMTGYKGERTETLADPIVVNPVLPEAVFSATPQSGERPLTVYFVQDSQGNPTEWDWDFGDGGSSDETQPVHVYQNPGLYTVSLTVTNQDGEDTEVKPNFITVTYRTIWVDDDGDDLTGDGSESAPYATIQKGIDEALDGDTVMVKAGTYLGVGNRDIQFPDYYLYVIGESGVESTIIDPEGSDRAFTLLNRDALIKGFTIQNGDRTSQVDKDGGAIYIDGDPIIEDCVIRSCAAEHGGGIYVGATTSQAELRDILFYDNSATIAGGAVYVSDATTVIENCTMADNAAVAGAAVAVSDLGAATLTRDLIAFNSYDGVACEGAGAAVTFDCSVFWEHSGGHVTGNCSFPSDPTEAVAADPLFCDRENDDYGVYVGSPCDPQESECELLVGALPTSCSDLDDWSVEMGRL
ncbi:MAG: PKD domain-containing protein, partial [bacterium]